MKKWIALGFGAAATALWFGARAPDDVPEPPLLSGLPATLETAAPATTATDQAAGAAVVKREAQSPAAVSPRRTYDEMRLAAGFELHSEFANTGSGTLYAYLRQHLDGNLQDEEFIGAASWHLAVRAASNIGYGNFDHRSPQYRKIAYYAVLAATALQDSAPVRHVAQNYLGIQGREEMGIALAQWAVSNFEDDSTRNLESFIQTMEHSATKRDYPLDEEKITEVLSWLYYFQETLPQPSGALPREEVPRA